MSSRGISRASSRVHETACWVRGSVVCDWTCAACPISAIGMAKIFVWRNLIAHALFEFFDFRKPALSGA
jgi:hypothetical protein